MGFVQKKKKKKRKRHQCKKCPYSFADNADLTTHLKHHDKKKTTPTTTKKKNEKSIQNPNLSCNVCGKRYVLAWALANHERVCKKSTKKGTKQPISSVSRSGKRKSRSLSKPNVKRRKVESKVFFLPLSCTKTKAKSCVLVRK